MIVCIHGRTAADTLGHVECLDCEELEALRRLEAAIRALHGNASDEEYRVISDRLVRAECDLDIIRARKGIGAIGHPETRGLDLWRKVEGR